MQMRSEHTLFCAHFVNIYNNLYATSLSHEVLYLMVCLTICLLESLDSHGR